MYIFPFHIYILMYHIRVHVWQPPLTVSVPVRASKLNEAAWSSRTMSAVAQARRHAESLGRLLASSRSDARAWLHSMLSSLACMEDKQAKNRSGTSTQVHEDKETFRKTGKYGNGPQKNNRRWKLRKKHAAKKRNHQATDFISRRIS